MLTFSPVDISNAITLNRYAYANGNPVSNIDPFGLTAKCANENRNGSNNTTSTPSIWDKAQNDDGTYSLYDNDRFGDRNSWHEQILSIEPSGPSFDLKEGNVGLGSLGVDLYTGGWEWEHADLSLMDFGHAEVSLQYKDSELSVGALASVWSPSFSISFWGITIELGAEILSAGAEVKSFNVDSNGISISAALGIGASLSVTW